MSNLHFGFDIGCASVGWAVVDDDYNIVDLGSNYLVRQIQKITKREETEEVKEECLDEGKIV